MRCFLRGIELVQESLTKAISKLDQWEPGTNLRAWLLTIVHNTFLSGYRAHQRETAHSAARRGDVHFPEPPVSPELRLHFQQIQKVFERLPQPYRDVLILVALEDLTYQEAAAVLGIPIGTVRSRTFRAREFMRAHVEGLQPKTARLAVHPEQEESPNA